VRGPRPSSQSGRRPEGKALVEAREAAAAADARAAAAEARAAVAEEQAAAAEAPLGPGRGHPYYKYVYQSFNMFF